MIGIVAVLKIQDGKAEEFEGVFRELSLKVRANEKGNLLYQLTRSRADLTPTRFWSSTRIRRP